MIPTKEEARKLFCEFNGANFYQKHARILADVMSWYANKLHYTNEADFWWIVGLLHDLDFERFHEEHCIKEKGTLNNRNIDYRIIHAVTSHGYLLTVNIPPEHEMEKVLYAIDELTGLISAVTKMMPSKSIQNLELKTVKKKFKDKKFASGCSREVKLGGAEMQGYGINYLIEQKILAMRESKAVNE